MSFLGRLYGLARSHIGIFPHAMILAILIELPLILFPVFAKQEYRSINIAHFGTDQHFYLTRAREVLDGNGLGNAILREGKNNQDPYFTWNERVLLAPYRWLGVADRINIATLYTIMNGVGIFILTILIYSLVYQLSGNKLLSATAAVFVIGGSSLVFYRKFFTSDMNVYGRAMSPYLSSIGLFTYLNLLTRCLVRPKARTTIAAIMAFGALFYIYLYAWTYALALNGILLFFFALGRDWNKAKTMALIMCGGLAIGAYNLFFLLRSLFSEAGRDIRYFHFVEHTRQPLFSNVGAVLLAIFAAYWWKNRKDERWLIILAFILAGWGVLNQQVVTGLRLQPGHYYWYFVVPLGIILALFMVWSLLKRSGQTLFCVVLLLVVYPNTAVGQYRATLATLPAKLQEQRFQPILSELQKDKTAAVILASGNDNAYLFTIFTRHDLVWHNGATYYQPDETRMKDALSLFLFLDRKARQDPSAFLQTAADDTSGTAEFHTHIFHALEGFTSGLTYPVYQKQLNAHDPALLPHRPQLIDELARNIKKLASDPTEVQRLLDGYHVEYVVWDEIEDPDWEVSVIPGLREIVSVGALHLYRRE